MKTTCCNCQVELRVEENGVMVLEMYQENREVYKVWFADIWHCPECETRILVNFSTLAAAQHHEKEKMDNYEKMSHEYAAKGKLYHLYERGKFRE
jgi:hypothetical protein